MTSRVLRKLDVSEAVRYILNCSTDTKVYIGSDSERFKHKGEWHADYMVAVVVHIDGCRGCKVFGEVVREPVYDQKKDRPAMRLMAEVTKVADIFSEVRKEMQDQVDGRLEVLVQKLDDGEITDLEYERQSEVLVDKLDKEMEIHLDINPDKAHGSSCVVQQAVGYIRGTCNVEPLIKPNAFAASFAADRGISLIDESTRSLEATKVA